MTSPCSECVKNGNGCCNSHSSGIFITLHDAVRIKKITGQKITDFATFEKAPKEWIKQLMDSKDEFINFYVNEQILQLKLNNEGCPFLSSNGCSIFNDRPGLCRLFPFEYELEGSTVKLKIISDENCLAFNTFKKNPRQALKAFGENIKEFKKFIKQYDKECDDYLAYKERLSNNEDELNKIINDYNIIT